MLRQALNELIASIENALGKKAVINKMPEQPGDVPLTYADIGKARALLGVTTKPGTPDDDAPSTSDAQVSPPAPCTCCGGRMVLIEIFERAAGSKSWACTPVTPRRDTS